jgi:hypothetical protein
MQFENGTIMLNQFTACFIDPLSKISSDPVGFPFFQALIDLESK